MAVASVPLSHIFETTVLQLERDLKTLPKNVWTIRACLERVVIFCNADSHTNKADIDEQWCRRKDHYNKHIGWTIPSWEMLSQIKQIGRPICDYGSGSGLLIHLLKLIGCDAYGVDYHHYTNEWGNVGKFCRPKVYVMSEDQIFHVPSDHIFLISWGYINRDPINDYIERGGKCVIIIGEDDEGCTHPPYDLFNDMSDWTCQIIEIPNFYGIYTKMSINRRTANL